MLGILLLFGKKKVGLSPSTLLAMSHVVANTLMLQKSFSNLLNLL